MNCRTRALGLMLGLLFLASATAFAVVPVRKGSQNGTNDSQPRMNLFGPTQPGPKDGGDVGIATQVICPNQDVAGAFEFDTTVFDPTDPNTLKKSGHCVSGTHKFLFQIQPTKIFKTLTITLSGLAGFVPGTDPNVSVTILLTVSRYAMTVATPWSCVQIWQKRICLSSTRRSMRRTIRSYSRFQILGQQLFHRAQTTKGRD